MFFAHFALRPAAAMLAPPERLRLLADALGRFFLWVSIAITAILASGVALIMLFAAGGARLGWHIHAMTGAGLLMMAIFAHIRFAPFRRLRRAVADADWAAGARAMAQIRALVLTNLVLGALTTAVVFLGRGWT
ncbi:MAG: CopD family protein [Burkholderiales bacterium]|nr:CopD family protein [Burkholderiales bacterium]